MFRWKQVRYTTMFLFLAFITWVGYRHQVLGGGPQGVPTVDALCPFGGLEGIYSYLKEGIWLRRLAPSALILFGTVAVGTLLVGRTFCGWLCPLGTIGEFTALIGRKLGIGGRELPAGLDRALRALKYVLLVVILYYTWTLGTLAWRAYDPWAAWMHLSAGWEEIVSTPWAFVVLFGAVIGASLFIERFWCRYLCPLGAALGILQKLSLTKVRRNRETCISCTKCDRSCPMGLHPMALEAVRDADCIACGRCTESCPVDGTLSFSFVGRKALSALAVGLIGVAIYFGAYGTAKATGYWQTFVSTSRETSKDPVDGVFEWMTIQQVADQVKLTPATVLQVGGLPADSPTDVSLKNMEGVDDEELKERLKEHFAANPSKANRAPAPVPSNPEEIKGSMTLNDVATGYGLDAAAILEKAGWPADTDPAAQLKAAGAAIGRETSDIRTAVKALLAEKKK